MSTPGDQQVQVGRSYTRARRFPLVIGKLPGGGRIVGGPYTLSQVGVMVATIIVLYVSTPVWAHLGYGDGVVYLALPYGLSWTVRHARIEGREPLRTLAGLAAQLGAPAAGRLRGRPYRPARPRLVRSGVFTIGPAAAERGRRG